MRQYKKQAIWYLAAVSSLAISVYIANKLLKGVVFGASDEGGHGFPDEAFYSGGPVDQAINALPLDLRKTVFSLLETGRTVEITRNVDIRTPSGNIEYSIGDGIALVRDSRLANFMDGLIKLGGGINNFYPDDVLTSVSTVDGYTISFVPIDKENRTKYTITFAKGSGI